MATTKQITAQYVEYIGTQVVNKFGGSYQTYQTLGKTWRQEMLYRQDIENFIMYRTDLFLHLLDVRDQGNFNSMYKVCYNISEHLSKYLIKKSPNLTRQVVTDTTLNKLFLKSPRFIAKFKKAYKKPIDLTNEKYVQCNPGVVAMYNAIKNREK